jgi:glycosyltransferase involved in cell wall biosynthesis
MSKIKLLVIPADKGGVGYFRSLLPHKYIDKYHSDEFDITIDYKPTLTLENLSKYDIIHYSKTLTNFEENTDLIKKLNENKVITVMDIDDYWEVDRSHPAFIPIQKEKLTEKILNNIRNANYVTTTTKLFQDKLKKINNNVIVLENAITNEETQYNPKDKKTEKLRIGWLGGAHHKGDIELLRGVINKLHSDKLLDKVQFVLCGFDTRGVIKNYKPDGSVFYTSMKSEELSWVEYEKIFTNDYKYLSKEYVEYLKEYKNIPNNFNEYYRRVWNKPVTSYATLYDEFDVLLVPVKETNFNYYKSNLKVVEAAYMNKAIIAQNYGPYTIDLVNYFETENGNSILVDSRKNHKDWYKAIKHLINNPEVVDVLKQNLKETVVDKYNLLNINKKRVEFYKNIFLLERFKETVDLYENIF